MAFIWVVCHSVFIDLLGAGGKAAPIENGNWNSTGWEFQLFREVYRPLFFGRRRMGVCIYLG